jgi:hypothetical protein
MYERAFDRFVFDVLMYDRTRHDGIRGSVSLFQFGVRREKKLSAN